MSMVTSDPQLTRGVRVGSLGILGLCREERLGGAAPLEGRLVRSKGGVYFSGSGVLTARALEYRFTVGGGGVYFFFGTFPIP